MIRLIPLCGIALIVAGIVQCLLSVILTPMLVLHPGAGSGAFLAREGASAIVALLLLFGCIGVLSSQLSRDTVFQRCAFIVALSGTALLFAVEWSNVFLLHILAQAAPASATALDRSSLTNVGYGAAAIVFAIGWIMLAASMLRANIAPRWSPIAIIAGFILIPALPGALGTSGGIIGNIVLGVGFGALGYAVASSSL